MKEITKEIKDYLLSIGYPDKEKISYMDMWLWLWRVKKIFIEPSIHFDSIKGYYFTAFIISNDLSKHIEESDPEEAIIAAINYLVENNLIK